MWRALLGSVASFASWLDQNGVALCDATLRFRAFHIQNVLAPLHSQQGICVPCGSPKDIISFELSHGVD
jgi:hypothetical protein